ncbi:MAG TPA: HEAT repeat domain-containing protein [bacterium]|nr:HEAT repeat domain-containing protein [bacterium]
MTLAASVLLSVLPQVFPGGDLKLPPKKPAVEQAPAVRPLSELERFRRDLLQMGSTPAKVARKLDEMGRDYPAIEELILRVARTARATEMANLMPVARRFGRTSGTPRVADELLFQLLARRLGKATRAVVDTMATLKGPDAKAALKQCLRAPIAAVRRHAVEVLGPRCDETDLPFALELSREQSLDLRLRAIDLLRAIGGEQATARLVELLSKDPALAAAACTALVRVGAPAVPVLSRRLEGPVVDRSYLYAAFALAEIDAASGAGNLPGVVMPKLIEHLRAPEALSRVLAAVPLADLAYRSSPGEGEAMPDIDIVDALLLVVEPEQFVPNLDLLRAPAERRLLLLTGRVVDEHSMPWRAWWRDHRASFLGVRSSVHVDAQNAGSAVVTLRQEGRTLRVLGEHMQSLAPDPGALEVVLNSAQMLELVRALEARGFGDPAAVRVEGALPRVRSLELRVAGGRSSVAVTVRPHAAFDGMAAAVREVLDRELWQLYRRDADGDRATFWAAERAWLDAHRDDLARGRRFLARALSGWADWSEELRARAVAFVTGHARRKDLLRESDGAEMLAALRTRPQPDAIDLQLLEVAASVPGDEVWRDCVEFAVGIGEGARSAVRGVFKVLGPDAVLGALTDERPLVRRAAVDEVVAARDLRAAPTLVELLADPDLAVRRAAVFACGHLRVAAASRPLVDMIVAAETDPLLRREALRSLGRVGGELAFPVLQKAMTAPAKEDKEAALRGLGELRDPRAAHLLAEFLVVGHGKDLGGLAQFHLQRQGKELAVPALRRRIPLVQDAEIRAELVLLLGLWQDPQNVPELMDLLRSPGEAATATQLLEGTTGVDLTNVDDRIVAIESWWRVHKNEPQSQWLLDALRAAHVRTSLAAEDFATGARRRLVPELARLMVECQEPRLWVLSSAVLRTVVGKDQGIVTMQTPVDVREGLAARYRLLLEEAGGR